MHEDGFEFIVIGAGIGGLMCAATLSRAGRRVLVLEQRSQPTGPPSITVRLGSIANNRAVAPFDGGYTALRVGWLEESGAFGGSWASGVRNEQAAGHFCAVPR